MNQRAVGEKQPAVMDMIQRNLQRNWEQVASHILWLADTCQLEEKHPDKDKACPPGIFEVSTFG